MAKKAQKRFRGFNRIQTRNLRNTVQYCDMLYQLNYKVSLEAGQERVQEEDCSISELND